MMVMILDRASLRLLMASVMMAMEFDMKPTRALNPTRIKFAMMQIILVLMTVFSRLVFVVCGIYIIIAWNDLGFRIRDKMMGGRSGLPEGFMDEGGREMCLELFDEYKNMENKKIC